MLARYAPTLALLGVPLMAGCLGIFDRDFEGSDAFECVDGTDNDMDGLLDCEDDDCDAAEACYDEWGQVSCDDIMDGVAGPRCEDICSND